MTTLALRSRSAVGPALAGPLLGGPRLAWIAIFVNVMPFQGPSLLPIPQPLGQGMVQGMLLVALVLALLANPGVVIRPNAFLMLLTAMAVLALMVSIHNEFVVGATYRAIRLVLFVAVLWALSRWWGQPDLPLLRAHLLWLRLLVVSVWVGVLVAPGAAFKEQGRLSGLVWPIPPPQVGHYCAVLIGCTVILWFCGVLTGRTIVSTLLAAGAALVATHTRTALLGLLVGLVVAGGSLFLGHVRVRRTVVVSIVVGLVGWTFLSPVIVSWLARGQSTEDLSQLTGRTKVWAAVAARQTTSLQELFGSGLSNKSFGGLAIDSNWIATHFELGRLGVAIVVAFLLSVLFAAVVRPAGPRRAIALFLVIYAVTASFTETGLGDASPYLLDLVVAASVVAIPPALVRRPDAAPGNTGSATSAASGGIAGASARVI
jgi:hypothetical protein